MLLYDAAMKSKIAMLLLTVAAATAAQSGTWIIPKGFTADEVTQRGDMAHLHGNAVVRRERGTLFSEDIEIHKGSSDFKTRGDSRLEVMDVKPNPGFKNIPMSPELFSADEFRQEGDLAIFHGNVKMKIVAASLRIWAADDAVLNTVTGSITVKGDATYVMLKLNGCAVDFWTGKSSSPCVRSDNLGALTLPQ